MKKYLKKYKVLILLLSPILNFSLFFFILNLLFPLQINIHYSQIITAEDGTVMQAFLSVDDKWRMKTELNEIIPEVKTAFIEKEDKYFYYHPGFNPLAIARAAFNNIIHTRKTSGASTITMQVARMLEPKERSYINKMAEIFRAMQLEWYYSKEEILQLYVNLVPFGGNIEGVKSASILYFGRLPNHLSLAQAVTLAIIPNRPNSLLLGKNNSFIEKERNRWLRILESEKCFNNEDIANALKEPINAKRERVPSIAPQLCRRLKKTQSNKEIIRSSIKTNIQAKVQQITYNYSQRLQHRNIHNAAIIVLNNKTRKVEAYVGSPDFNDAAHAGQVDGVIGLRSPGSTLKPLVYGVAFDKGIMTPKTIITDVPSDFDGYAPDNFDKTFNGNVSIEKALAYSLNIPAVKTLELVTVPVLTDVLKKANFRQIQKDERNLGLSLILGGCGVTLEELSMLFASFANNGSFLKYSYLKEDTAKVKGIQIISPSSAYMLTDILTQITRPDLPNNYQSSYHVPKVAWKTGTSYGRRDAWSIGYNEKYTVGVWVGNFSGEGVPELTGADIATPLLFQIFNTIDYNSDAQWSFKPSELGVRFVCPESGKVPGEYCNNSIADFYIANISSAEKCAHLKPFFLSPDESFCYCASCLPESGYKKKLFPNYAPELLDYYKSQGVSYQKIPEHNPRCERIFAGKPPKIVSPVSDKEYIVDKEEPAELKLSCHAGNDVTKVFWYINNQFYREARPAESIFFRPSEGVVKISCSDDRGRNSNISIIIKYQ